MHLIFPKRTTTRQITDENGTATTKDEVFVVNSYDQEFGHTENSLEADFRFPGEGEAISGEVGTISTFPSSERLRLGRTET